MTRRDGAKLAIQEAVLTYCDANGLQPIELRTKATDAQKKTLLKMISQHYPYGQRAMHPYKVWLSEVKVFREWLIHKDTPITEGLFSEPSSPTTGD